MNNTHGQPAKPRPRRAAPPPTLGTGVLPVEQPFTQINPECKIVEPLSQKKSGDKVQKVRVALYARVSTTDQHCEMQLGEMRGYVGARGWDVVGEYVDHGFSGKNMKRPAMVRCMGVARTRAVDVVMVWKLDRWGRTMQQLVQDVLEFDSLKVRFIAITQGIDTDASNPMSRLMLHLMGAFAEFERAVIVERVQAGVRNAQRNGTRSGKAIGRPVKVFNRGQVVEMREAGASLRDISIATGQAVTTIRRVLA